MKKELYGITLGMAIMIAFAMPALAMDINSEMAGYAEGLMQSQDMISSYATHCDVYSTNVSGLEIGISVISSSTSDTTLGLLACEGALTCQKVMVKYSSLHYCTFRVLDRTLLDQTSVVLMSVVVRQRH